MLSNFDLRFHKILFNSFFFVYYLTVLPLTVVDLAIRPPVFSLTLLQTVGVFALVGL
jgi:hypothetical protein